MGARSRMQVQNVMGRPPCAAWTVGGAACQVRSAWACSSNASVVVSIAAVRTPAPSATKATAMRQPSRLRCRTPRAADGGTRWLPPLSPGTTPARGPRRASSSRGLRIPAIRAPVPAEVQAAHRLINVRPGDAAVVQEPRAPGRLPCALVVRHRHSAWVTGHGRREEAPTRASLDKQPGSRAANASLTGTGDVLSFTVVTTVWRKW